MPWALVPEFFYDFCLARVYDRSDFSGPKRSWFIRPSVRPSFSLSVSLSLPLFYAQRVRALFSSCRLMTRSRNIIFTPRPPFLRLPFFAARLFAATRMHQIRFACAAGHLRRWRARKGSPFFPRLHLGNGDIFKSRETNARGLVREPSRAVDHVCTQLMREKNFKKILYMLKI